MLPNTPAMDYRDFWCVAPALVLAAWGLVVVAADLAWRRKLDADARRLAVGRLSLLGVGLALASTLLLAWIDALALTDADRLERIFGAPLGTYFAKSDGLIFLGTLATGLPTDVLNLLFLTTLGLVVWMSTAYAFTDDVGEYFALLLWATVGMMLLAASEELATLFVALETMTICLYLAAAFERSGRRSPEAGLKYFLYGSVSSALFLYGLSLVYGLTGTTYLDAVGRVLAGNGAGLSGNLAGAAALLLLLAGFGFKVSAAPFHQWAPDVYEGAPAPVAAWIATGSKVAGFVAMLKVFLHALGPWSHPTGRILGPGWLGLLAAVAAATMTYGNFAALAQTNLKRMLAYSSIAHAGYMLVGVAAAASSTEGPAAAGAVLYYLVVYAFANIGAFALAAWLARDRGGEAIDDLNGLGGRSPILAACVLVLMLSLIGIPPFGGFFAKLYVFMEALRQESSETRLVLTWLVAVGLFNSVVSAFYYVRVLKAMYLREPSGQPLRPAGPAVAAPIALAAAVVTVLGIAPGPLADVMQAVARPMLTARRSDAPVARATPPAAPQARPVAWLPSSPTD